MNKAIISVLGKDRPGIIAAVCKILFENDCNIENVSQTILQSEFAGIFIVSMPQDTSLQELHASLKNRLAAIDQDVFIKPLLQQDRVDRAQEIESFVITTKGPDQKGLVAGITAIIARYGANITNLQAVFKGGSEPDNNIMIYEVDVPKTVDQQAFAADLRQGAEALLLDISIQHRNIFEAINRI
jgi:glycine cleavage system transcriptional repressor